MLKKNISLILSIFSFILTLVLCGSYFSKPYLSSNDEKQFIKKLLTHVRSCVEFNDELQNKNDVLSLVQQIEKTKFSHEIGNDDLRSKYVFSQGCFEHVLACSQVLGEVNQLIGVIHTPTIATPLCVKPNQSVDEALDISIRHDLNKLLTVRSRAQIVREYLKKGGRLYMVYPEGGERQRTPEQLSIYQEELAAHPKNLIDWTLSCSSMDPEMVGATYFFRNSDRQVYAFSIKSRQAIDIQQKAEWGIWFGSLNDPVIIDRINLVMDYLVANDGPDLRTEVL